MEAHHSKPARVGLATFRASLLLLLLLSAIPLACRHSTPVSTITFTQVPFSNDGGPSTTGVFAGTITNSLPGDHVVIYAFSGQQWWVQPTALEPFTAVQADGSWSAQIHLGHKYAALLVRGGYDAAAKRPSLPSLSRKIWAEAVADGVAQPPAKVKTLHFSGYDWNALETMKDIGGKAHRYDPDNVWVDAEGRMHLRLFRTKYEWVCSDVSTQRSLGYGTYRFDLENPGALDPSAMLSLNTWTDDVDNQNHHELEVHVSRWGNPESKNAEFVVEPYYVPSNVYRFEMPAGPMSAIFHWVPGSAAFTAQRPGTQTPVATWNFTTNVPTSGPERIHVSLCEYAYGHVSLQRDTEVVLDRFQFLP